MSQKKGITLYLSMTDEDVVRKFRGVIGMGSVNGPYKQKKGVSRKQTYKPAWTWSLTRAEMVQAVLAAFWTFLGDRRRKKAEDAIKLGATKRPKGGVASHCRLGHKFTPESTYYTRKGYRMCRECMRVNTARNQKTRRARIRAKLNVHRHLRGIEDSGSQSAPQE